MDEDTKIDNNNINTEKEKNIFPEEASTYDIKNKVQGGDAETSEEFHHSLIVPDAVRIKECAEEHSESEYYYDEEDGLEIRITQCNKRALSRFEITYKLETFKKNALIIFNQNNANDKEPRHGTEQDVKSLKNTFEKLNFVIETLHDLPCNDIMTKLNEFTTKDYTEYGAIGVVVLSHGSNYGMLEAAKHKGKPTYFRDVQIIEKLISRNNPTLVTKPKFLIIQACRGKLVKPPIAVLETDSAETYTETKAARGVSYYHLPEAADLLVLHSSYEGTPSFRYNVTGSWLIQSLCRTIDRLASSHDLETIITEVKREVSIERLRVYRNRLAACQMTCEMICQMPVLTSTLTRKLYLKKFSDPSTVSRSNSPLIFEEEYATPWNFSVLDSSLQSPSVPFTFIAFIIIHILVSLFFSGSFNIHINLSQN